ncbi:hypothetical protein BFV94_4874 [Alteromonas macleodii]|uniref:Secreted protein n=1 Tax=Alteromonas macleodii TaxID=28108 RepID=A0AB36FQT4_ALTMA|nr:hypothetical protein BFV95_4857 [Alteromonas macleodii]OES24125.1 hypothetical protein BFV94_4874 [Alteromonas macleodii]
MSGRRRLNAHFSTFMLAPTGPAAFSVLGLALLASGAAPPFDSPHSEHSWFPVVVLWANAGKVTCE